MKDQDERTKSRSIDVEQATLDPGSVFASPEEVLDRGDLSTAQKIEVLRRWHYDASEEAVAVEEGMPGGESDLLRRVLLALEQLTGGIDTELVGQSKQRGVPRSAIKPK